MDRIHPGMDGNAGWSRGCKRTTYFNHDTFAEQISVKTSLTFV